MKFALKKIYDFACVCLYALAAIGGIAYLFFYEHYIFGVAAIATTAMATPYIVGRIKDIMGL